MAQAETDVETHPAGQHFESLVGYLRHLVDEHAVEETPDLWCLGRTHFDAMHDEAHFEGRFGVGKRRMLGYRQRSTAHGRRRGRCPYCHGLYVIRKDGKFVWHAIRPNEPCRGALEVTAPAGGIKGS